MGKRTGRRTRSDDAGRPTGPGFPTFVHNQYTFEGEMEQLSWFTRQVNRRGIPDHGIGRIMGWLLAAGAAVFAIGLLLSLVTNLLRWT